MFFHFLNAVTSMQRVVVFSGAGVSAESGLKTFRGDDGLWEGHRVEEVATPASWEADPARVLRFYNERRKQVRSAQPNAAHKALSALQRCFEVDINTQNVDDLHERAGSARVLATLHYLACPVSDSSCASNDPSWLTATRPTPAPECTPTRVLLGS